MTRRTITAALACMLISGSISLGDDWAQWRGPNRDGKSAETGLMKEWPAKGPTELWSYDELGEGYSTVAVADGVIYTTGMERDKQGYLYAFGLDGKRKWRVSYGPEWSKSYGGARTTPTVDDGMVYVMSGMGRIVCYDVKTHKQVWEIDTARKFRGRNISWGIAESVLIDGDNVICTPGGANATVVALNKKTGKTVWTSKGLSERSAYCSPMLIRDGKKNLIVTACESNVVGLDAATGQVHWKYPMRNKYKVHPNTPIYSGGIVYGTSGYGWGQFAVKLSDDGKSITKLWQNKNLDVHHGGAILIDGKVYGTTARSKMWVCVDPKTGRTLHTTPAIRKGSLTYAEGMIYGYSETGAVGLMKPSARGLDVVSKFRIRKGSKQHWAHPVVSGGRLYIRHGHVLMAFDIKAQ